MNQENMPTPVTLNDFTRQWHMIREKALAALDHTGSSGWYILGEETRTFEASLANTCGVAHAIACANGLDAIEMSLRSLGLKQGQRVLTTPHTAFATVLGIMRAGGTPCFIDTDETGLIDLELAAQICETRPDITFFLPVHLYGHALPLAQLASLRDRFGLTIVEDCAQAIGASSHGQSVGSVGQCSALSFYPTKNLGALGSGGAVLTNSADVANHAAMIGNYGQSEKYKHDYYGMNSRIDEMQAALLRECLLPHLTTFTQTRRQIAARYLQHITHASITLPPIPDGSASVWHLFPVQVENREDFREFMRGRGIETGVHYPWLAHQQLALTQNSPYEILSPLPCAEHWAASEVSLPIHPFMHPGEVERVIDSCNQWRA